MTTGMAATDPYGLPCVHLLEYPVNPDQCKYAHGLGSYGPMHRDQSGHAVCAACGTVVYGAGNPLDLSGLPKGDLRVAELRLA